MSLISIGLSGLNASQVALTVIGNNIANAATVGYSRQQTATVASAMQNIGAGFVGTGTTLSDVRRIYNSYLDKQLQTSTSLNSDATAYLTQANSTDSLLSNSSTGISSVLTSFFSALQTASATPSDTSSRQLLLTQAQTLSNRFNSISSQLNQQNDSINSQLTTLTGQVNALTSTIVTLNKQITEQSASGNAPNSLLDARSEAVRSLNELVGVSVQENNGSYDVTMGTGQALVTGNSANSLSAVANGIDKSQYNLQMNYQQQSIDVTSVASGGTIGGLLRYRSDVLTPSMNQLGQIATVVADSINTQLGQGLDSKGQFGASLFSSINSVAAISQRSLASGNRSGSGNLDVTIINSSALTAYDYQVTFTSDTGDYSVTRSDGTSKGSHNLSDSPVPIFDGFTLALKPNSGTLCAGDTFKVTPTRNAAKSITTTMTDSSTLALAAPLSGTASAGNLGTSSITQPVLTTSLDIYNNVALSQLQSAVKDSMPVKLVFGKGGGATQDYSVYDAQGHSIDIDRGTIVPGQSNTLSIKVPWTDSSGTAQAFSFETSVSGSPAEGDSYTMAFNANGTSDNRNAQSLLSLQSSATVGGVSFTSSYASLVENVGAKASQAGVDSAATKAVMTQAKSSRDSVSGVNLDDEAANLVKFQQYYTASSQIIKVAQEIFSTLINNL